MGSPGTDPNSRRSRFAGSDLALKLCPTAFSPPRRERTVRFALPPVRSDAPGSWDGRA